MSADRAISEQVYLSYEQKIKIDKARFVPPNTL